MSGIGSSEFILLLVIGLIVLGPRRLPEIANKIGSWIGQARRMTRAMKRQLEDELNLDDINRIKPSSILTPAAPPRSIAATPETPSDNARASADAAEPEAHVPKDDDTYSPAHDDVTKAADDAGAVKEQDA